MNKNIDPYILYGGHGWYEMKAFVEASDLTILEDDRQRLLERIYTGAKYKDREPMTSIAKDLGVSNSYVTYMRNQALRQLRFAALVKQ